MRALLILTICFSGQLLDSNALAQWTQRADFGSFGRHRGAAIDIGNKGYCGMGHLNGTGIDTWYPDWWQYDPAIDTWTQKADYPGNSGNGDQDVVLISVGLMAYGGLGQIDGNGFYKYDPSINQWSQITSPPITLAFNDVTPFTIGDKGYFAALFSDIFFEYDPSLDTWTQLNNIPFTTNWGTPSFTINGKGYMKNGADFYEYSPATDSWAFKAQFPGLTPNRPKGISQYNYGFIIGGFTDLPWVWSKNVWRYDPVTDSWTQLGDFPGSTRRWALIMNINDHVYYGLGTNGTNFNDFWEFNSIAESNEIMASTFNVYPTLADEHINFSSEENQEFNVSIYNLNGELIKSISTENGEIKFSRSYLSSGTYIYHISVKDQVIKTDKFVFI